MENAADKYRHGCDTKPISTCFLFILTIVMTVNGFQQRKCGGLKHGFTATDKRILQTSAFWLEKVRSPVQCVSHCHAEPDCLSVNYLKVDHLCQLTNVTRVLCPKDFITDSGSIYYDGGDHSSKKLLETWQNPYCGKTPVSTSESVTSPTGSSGVWIEQVLSVTGKPSTQSSTSNGHPSHLVNFVAGRANDGFTDVNMQQSPYCSHTRHELHPWWRVDLGREHWLGIITVVNRGDCCSDRLAGATVHAGLSPDIATNLICGSPVSQAQALDGAWIEFVCDPRTLARYVIVDINTGDPKSSLNICEVMVKEYIFMRN